MAACKLLGWVNIPASFGSANKEDRRSREIIENVFRRDLDPLDRAAFVAELYAIEKTQAGIPIDGDGRSFSANVRWQKGLKAEASDATAMIAGAYTMQEAVAQKLGMSERTLRDDLLLFKRLSPSLVERVRKLPIASNAAALRKLAGMEPKAQIKAVALMEDGQAKDINSALAIIAKKAPVSAEDKRLKTFTDTFARMGRKEQMAALMLLPMPKGWTLDFGAPKAVQADDVVDIEDYLKRGAAECKA